PHFPLSLLVSQAGTAAFRICAFNAQRFAEGKVNKPKVVDILVKVGGKVAQRVPPSCFFPLSLSRLNPMGFSFPRYDDQHSYSYLTSPLLGRGNYQERYVYIYRNQKTQILDYYTYEDMHPDRPDVFAREPFIARFSMANKELPELVLIPQHTMPSKAEAEIDALYDVFLNVQERWATEDMIFLGDFNADCGYVAKKRWKDIRLRQKPGFHWLIGDQADTTVREKTHCAYDRIVIHGECCLDAVVPGSARPFDFPKEFGLSEEEVPITFGKETEMM
uniref:Deoxyribonuclease n=1 Tax=Naja naja TaxID=35670 RepID=A0A8C6YFF1_NAJNA